MGYGVLEYWTIEKFDNHLNPSFHYSNRGLYLLRTSCGSLLEWMELCKTSKAPIDFTPQEL
jgi:hypothetical protein